MQQHCLQTSAPREKKKEASHWWDFLSHCKEAADSSDSEDDSPQENDRSYANNNDMMTCNTGPTNSADDDLAIKESASVTLIDARSKTSADGENDGKAARTHPQTPRGRRIVLRFHHLSLLLLPPLRLMMMMMRTTSLKFLHSNP